MANAARFAGAFGEVFARFAFLPLADRFQFTARFVEEDQRALVRGRTPQKEPGTRCAPLASPRTKPWSRVNKLTVWLVSLKAIVEGKYQWFAVGA